MSDQDRAFFSTFLLILVLLVIMAVAFYIIANVISGYTETSAERSADGMQQAAVEERLTPVGRVNVGGEATQAAAEAAGAGEPRSGEQVVQAVCASCHQAGVLGAPKIGVKGDWSARLDKGMESLTDNAVNGFKQMPPKGGDGSLSREEVREAIVYMLEETGLKVAAAEAAAQTGAQQQPAAAGSDGGGIVPGTIDLTKGRQVYGQVCMSCHDTGAAGAPKKGDAQAWQPRIEKGWSTLVDHALNGFKAMPPKGGRPGLPDADVEAAVAYLVKESR